MQKTLYQTAEAGDTYLIEDTGGYQTADAGVSIRQRTQESLYQTADAEASLPDSGCRRHSIRQRMQEYLYQTVDEGVSIPDSGCRSLSIRQLMQESSIR